jgi:hypothetical protein
VVTRAALASLLVGVVVAVAAGQGPVDGRPLLGHWAGRWTSSAGSSDNMYLDVAAADGGRVRGSVFIAVATPGEGYYNRDLPFSGAFDGSELRVWIPPALWLTLTLAGDRLRGSVQGQQTYGTVALDRQRAPDAGPPAVRR